MEKLNAKEAVERIRELLFGKTLATPPVPAKTATSTEYQVKDGSTMVATPDMSKGNPVHLKTADGTTPAPDGEYSLTSGHTCSVVGGICMDLTQPDENDIAMKAEFEEIKTQFATQTTALEAMKADFAAVKLAKETTEAEKVALETEKAELVAKFDAQTEQMTKVLEIVENLAKAPAELPAQVANTIMGAVSKAEKDSAKELAQAAMADFFKNKNKHGLNVN